MSVLSVEKPIPSASASPPRGGELTHRIVLGTGQQTVARVLAAMCSFAVLLLVSHLADPHEFGIYNYYVTAFAMAITFSNFGANGIAIREMARTPARTGVILGSIIRFKLVTGTIAFAVVAVLALTHERDALSVVLVSAAALHLVAAAFSSGQCVFHAELRFLVPSVALVAGMAVFLVGALIAYGCGVTRASAYLALYGLGQVVQTAILDRASRRLVAPAYTESWREFSLMFREMLPIGISALASTLYYYVNTLLLRDLRGEVEVGEFNAAYRIVTLGVMVPMLFTQALFPVLSRYARSDSRAFAVMLRRSFFYLLVVGAPIGAALQILAPQVLGALYRSQFSHVAPTLRILGWAMVCIFASSSLVTTLTAQGRQAVFTRIAICAGTFNVALNLLLIPRLGIEGAALTTLLTEVLVLTACALSQRGKLALPLLDRDLLLKVPLVCAVVAGAASLVRGLPIWWSMPVLALVLAGALWALNCFPIDLLAGYDGARKPHLRRGNSSCPSGP